MRNVGAAQSNHLYYFAFSTSPPLRAPLLLSSRCGLVSTPQLDPAPAALYSRSVQTNALFLRPDPHIYPPSVPLLSTFTSCWRRKRNVYLHTRCSRSSPPSPSPTPPLCLFKKVAKRFSCASPSLCWWVRLRSGGTSQPCPFSHRRAQVVHAAVSVRKVLARGVGGGRAEETHKSLDDLRR